MLLDFVGQSGQSEKRPGLGRWVMLLIKETKMELTRLHASSRLISCMNKASSVGLYVLLWLSGC